MTDAGERILPWPDGAPDSESGAYRRRAARVVGITTRHLTAEIAEKAENAGIITRSASGGSA